MIKAFKDLLTSIDILNTINGGVSEPQVLFREETGGQEVRVRIPGIEREALQVEINNNELSVYYLIPIESSGKLMQMPRVVFSQQIPYFIRINGIKAVYEENELVVKLPFNKRSNGYHKRLRIEEE